MDERARDSFESFRPRNYQVSQKVYQDATPSEIPRSHAWPRSVSGQTDVIRAVIRTAWRPCKLARKETRRSRRRAAAYGPLLISSYAGLLHPKSSAFLLQIPMNIIRKSRLIVWAMTSPILMRRGSRTRVSPSFHTCGIHCFVYFEIFLPLPFPPPCPALLIASAALSIWRRVSVHISDAL